MTKFEKDLELAKKGGRECERMLYKREKLIETVMRELRRQTRPTWRAMSSTGSNN